MSGVRKRSHEEDGVTHTSSSSSAKYPHEDSGSSSYPKSTHPPPVTTHPPPAQVHHHHHQQQQPQSHPHLHTVRHHPPLAAAVSESRTVKGPISEPRDGGERRSPLHGVYWSPSLPATGSSESRDNRSDGREIHGEAKREIHGPKGERDAKFERSGDDSGKGNTGGYSRNDGRGIYGETKREIQGPKPERVGDDFKMEKEGHAHLPWKEQKDCHRGKRVESSSANVEPWVVSRVNPQGSTEVGAKYLSAPVEGGAHLQVMYPWMCKPSLYERFDKRQVCVEMICPCALVGNVDLLEKLKKKNREADLRVYEHRGFSSIFISAVEQFSQTYAPTFYAALDLLPLCSTYDQAGSRSVTFVITARQQKLISAGLIDFWTKTYSCSVHCLERRKGVYHLAFTGTEEGSRTLFCRIFFLFRKDVFWRGHSHAVDFRTIEVEQSYIGPRMNGDTINLDFVKALIEGFKKQLPLHIRYVNQILLQTTHILESLPTLVDIHVDDGQCVIVCGDIHGQFYDLCNIFDKEGFPCQEKQFLFNGDFVDRGSFSVETILTLFALKCACPLWIHLARGNHESRSLNEVHGFEKEVLAKLNETVMDMFSDTFCCLPLAHVLNRKIIVLHGGLFSRDGVTLSDIKSIHRFCQPPKRGLMRDLLWSDPQDSPGRSRSTRGEGIIFFGEDVTESFLRDNNLDLLVRSHELKDKGYEISHNGKLITVFSAPNYCDRIGGGYLFGLPIGFVGDSVGATLGSGAAFLLGRTIGKPFVVAKLKDYPQFQSVALAIEKSGFKHVELPLICNSNHAGTILAFFLPITLALVYVGTTLKDLSDATHKWSELSFGHWASLILSLVVSVILMVCVTKVAQNALRKALAEHGGDMNGAVAASPELNDVVDAPADLNEPLLIKIDSQSPQDQENQSHEKSCWLNYFVQ
ncbi:hypothetical protein F2Q69_00000799 [Brassica cretica]|uniref:protein-serine/threonine phosphatase n=1 Tax=Brassica cretica TaxID=69181 RepID=A0A8S9P196_BRACR|nr:hypothetical protein F2Q69_00000799 [Brassica cretica]